MPEFRVGDKVQVELPRGYSKRGVLGISVLYTTSPEARFENAVGTITQINPRGPYSVPQYLVDFRAHDNARLGIPWQAQWFREEWLNLLERASGEAPPPPPPTPPGPPVRAEDSKGPFHRGAEPGGEDRTPEQAAEEAARLDTPTAAPPGSVDIPGPGKRPSGPGGTTAAGATLQTEQPSDVAGSQETGDSFSATASPAGEDDAVHESLASSAVIGGDRVGRGAGLLTPSAVPESADDGSGEAGIAAPVLTDDGEFVDVDEHARAATAGGSLSTELEDAEPAGIAGITGGGAPVGIAVAPPEADEPDVVPGGAVEEAELGAATMEAVLAGPADLTTTGAAAAEPVGFVRVSGVRDCPPGYPIKGNASSKIFHLPGQSSYDATMPEICFASAEDAIAAGFRPRRGASGAREARETFATLGATGIEQDEAAAVGEIGDTPTLAGAPATKPAPRAEAPAADAVASEPFADPGDEHHAGRRKVSGSVPSATPWETEPDERPAASAVTGEASTATTAAASTAGSVDVRASLAAGATSGPGWVRGDGSRACPAEFPLKGNAKSMIYHRPADDSYTQTIPEVCFATDEAAEAAGFRSRHGSHHARHTKGKGRR